MSGSDSGPPHRFRETRSCHLSYEFGALEIDPDAWHALYAARSRPFPEPPTARIAVKVINHYGDEVMKVFKVG